MTLEMPKTRRSFSSDRDELSYLAKKIRYWLLSRDDRAYALRFADRFESLLRSNRRRLSGSIILHEYLALLYSLKEESRQEIKHQEKIVDLIRQLHEIGGPVDPYDDEELIDQMSILAALYYERRQFRKALAILEQARRLSAKCDLPFHDSALLEELQSILKKTVSRPLS